ncbi:uncharacterized protein LOC113495061 isoform X2 [Trichoplusia ni]|uniref:Uncharacterized protein LOC113495061 isoform X2 n=1 Tax=Trichoplusia ni TaxID=7111 RepID=A0A7E5VM99_TRINI|nr:uncharacterized protein LOC113495061 isoform X2 [Trichoplusia ni]
MEELYADLDNYNEVNCIQELRTENTELKVKLEEHATALEKLQKDYDTLASEFKKLENNYSSLLKTARSEIERKTQRINQLNKEKDLMVVNAVEKGVIIRRHFNKVSQGPNLNKMSAEKPSGNNKLKDNFKAKNVDAKNKNYETQSKDNVPDLRPSNKSDYHKPIENPTYHKEQNDPPLTVASSIRDRRKSTPAVPMPQEKFSSEEEFDQNISAKSNRDIPPSSKFDRRNSNRYDRQSNRSETSSLEDRNSNYRESSRHYLEYSKDTGYKGGRPSRSSDKPHHDKNSYRGRDKSRHRNHYSPERASRGSQRDFKDDFPRHEHDRYRTPESPPRESFNRYHQRSEDRYINSDRHAYDYEKHRSSYEERFAPKHRLSTDYDEPHSKRPRIENFGNPDVHFKGEHHRPPLGQDVVDKQRASAFSPDDYDNRHATCQSPDYEHSDSAVANPKEIMASAATPLDDPRVTSKKYVIKKENGKEVLSTAVGRNVDIKPINKIGWNFEPVDVPIALVRRPSQCSEGLVKDINCLSNESVESGEICFDSDNEKRETNQAKEICHTKSITKNSSKQDPNLDKPIAKYKIPKVGQSNKNTNAKLNVPVIEVGEYGTKNKNNTDKVEIAEISKKATDKMVSKYKNILCNLSNTNKSKEDESQKQVLHNNSLTAKIAIVADDLELSDENSDNVEIHKLVTEKKHIKDQLKMTKTKKDDSKTKISNNINTEQETVANTVSDAVNLPVHEKSKECDSTKKQNGKKKRTKSKDSLSKDLLKTNVVQDCEKKTKSKHEKDCKSKESHNKFSDLFGDTSNSLMTPEDLGLPSYLPICENALDMKLDDIIDSKTHKTSDCPDVISKMNKPTEPVITAKEIIIENKIPDILQKSNSDKEGSEKECPGYSSDMITLDMYKNLNSETDANEPGVVQTVIISKGLQQQYDDGNAAVMEAPVNVAPLYNINRDVTDKNQIQATISFKKQDMKALATSTPHKELTDLKIGTESSIKDFKPDNNIVKSPDSGVQSVNQSQAILDTQDAPDVRIFVKRRRKVVKQTPVT